jgi:hypothetical protein
MWTMFWIFRCLMLFFHCSFIFSHNLIVLRLHSTWCITIFFWCCIGVCFWTWTPIGCRRIVCQNVLYIVQLGVFVVWCVVVTNDSCKHWCYNTWQSTHQKNLIHTNTYKLQMFSNKTHTNKQDIQTTKKMQKK